LKSPGYGKDLTELVERLRKDLSAPKVPFIASELSPLNPASAAAVAEFNKIVRGLNMPGYGCISGEGLEDKGDKLHLSTASARTLGKRYAEKMKSMQAGAQK